MVAKVEEDTDGSDDYDSDEYETDSDDDSDEYTDEYDTDEYDTDEYDTDDEEKYAPLVQQQSVGMEDGPILPTSPFMPAGDSCRGIGVIIVILYHMGYERFKNAWFVISLFFSLSGFIMTKNTVETFERRGHVDIFKFWAKRVSRLFPALLLTLVIILLSQKLPIRKNDGVTFQREGEDTWYATIFMTNYNLAYNQVDDYFNEFAIPSITRHMWTLSIEEQYYIVWPLVLVMITKLILLMPKSKRKEIDQDGRRKRDRDVYVISGTSRRCISAILMLDIIVMTVSYYSSMTTIEKYDMSTAYYSTMCRMGDIAAGGFTYSSTRLIPSLSRRWFRDPNLPPMSFKMRVILELMVATLFVTLVSVPMIQTPTEEMLIIYFEKLRLFVSLLLYGFVASTIQLSEPLPRWAIVSKIFSFKPLIITGVISYGVYVFHWPILVYFGDPNGIGKKKVALGWEDPYEGPLGYDGRNAVLFLVVMVIGYVSFMFFEKPLLLVSKVTMPMKTIATGFLSIGITLAINWLITKDLPPMATFEVDQGEAFESLDTRFTPVFFSSEQMKSQRNLFLEKLDYRTRSIFPEGGESYNTILANYWNQEFVDSDANVIIACKNLKKLQSPCHDSPVWKENTYWLWLESGYLCGPGPENTQVDFQERCDELIPISELPVFEMPLGDHLSNSQLLEQVKIQVYELIFATEDALPGVINQDTISRLETEYERVMNGEEITPLNGSGEMWDPIRITMMGDSVGVRIGMFWNDIVEMDMPVLDDELFPSIQLENGAQGGMPAIAYFACLSTHPKYQYEQCHHFKKSTPAFVLDTIERTLPNVIVLHDGHHGRDNGQFGQEASKMGLETFFEKHMALNILLNEAKKFGVEHVFFATLSRVETAPMEEYIKEMNIIMQMVDTLGCPKGDPSGIWFSVLDWAKLVCPLIDKMELNQCVQEVHGFEAILPDKIHPSGDSGLWLTRESLAATLAEIAKHSLPDKFGTYFTWDEAIDNPISKHMLKLAPPDGDPFLEDIVSSYYLCPYQDLEAMERDYRSRRFPEYMDYKNTMYRSYKDSVHYDGFDAEKNSQYVNLDAHIYGNSNEALNWYSNSQEVATQYQNRVILRGPDPSQPGNSAVLDWTVSQTHIYLAVAAPATGYLGFGLADAGGGMIGADMVFLESENPNLLRDTYTTDEGKPQTDDCACDWELLNSEIRNGYMFFETVRLLDTGDSQDQKITNDSDPLTPAHRVLVAWGDSKTVNSIEVNQSKGSVRFFQEEVEESFDSVMEKESEDSFTIQAVNFQPTATETNYFRSCLTKDEMVSKGLPRTENKMHLIGFEPIIQAKNSAYVHHYLLFGSLSHNCDGEFEELIWFWGGGLNSLALPDFLGLPFNGENEFNSFKLHIHYHNPLLRSDIVDSSGIRMYWTSNLRKEEMGVFNLGDPWVKKNYSPLGKGLSRHDFACPSSCSDSFMDGKPITVFQEIHHAHRLGVQTVIDHFRNGEKIRSGKVEYFDWYTLGNPKVVQESFTVEPGDSFTMSCYFEDEPGLNTVFGFGAKDEMCVGAFFYYPRVERDDWRCGYKVAAEECCSTYKREKISNVKALGRDFPFGETGGGKCPSHL